MQTHAMINTTLSTNKQNEIFSLQKLPNDILNEIICSLFFRGSIKSILRLSQTNKNFYNFIFIHLPLINQSNTSELNESLVFLNKIFDKFESELNGILDEQKIWDAKLSNIEKDFINRRSYLANRRSYFVFLNTDSDTAQLIQFIPLIFLIIMGAIDLIDFVHQDNTDNLSSLTKAIFSAMLATNEFFSNLMNKDKNDIAPIVVTSFVITFGFMALGLTPNYLIKGLHELGVFILDHLNLYTKKRATSMDRDLSGINEKQKTFHNNYIYFFQFLEHNNLMNTKVEHIKNKMNFPHNPLKFFEPKPRKLFSITSDNESSYLTQLNNKDQQQMMHHQENVFKTITDDFAQEEINLLTHQRKQKR